MNVHSSLHLHLSLYFNSHRCKYVRETSRVVEFVYDVITRGPTVLPLCLNAMLPQRVCRAQQCARLGRHVLASEQAQENTAPFKN